MTIILLLIAVAIITGIYFWINAIIADQRSTPLAQKLKIFTLLGIGAAILAGIFLFYREEVRTGCKEKFPSNADSYVKCVKEEN
jgi:uncharacterized protein YxeA